MSVQSRESAAKRSHDQHKNPKSDIEISQAAEMRPILEVAADKLGIPAESLLPYGHYKAKVSLDYIASLAGRRWDAVVDTAAYVPSIVARAAALLAPSVGSYTLISTRSVYTTHADSNEDGPVAERQRPPQVTVCGETEKGDEQGNLIEPQENQRPHPGDEPGRPEDAGLPPRAANDDFLNEATGKEGVRVRRGEQPPPGN